MPCLLFLQGGPGFESPRPSEAGAWLKRACKEFRVFLLDQACPESFFEYHTVIEYDYQDFWWVLLGLQRGTGLSTPLTTSSLGQFSSAQEQADYLQHFRADSIVKDAEYLRNILVPSREPWTVLGQVCALFSLIQQFDWFEILNHLPTLESMLVLKYAYIFYFAELWWILCSYIPQFGSIWAETGAAYWWSSTHWFRMHCGTCVS